MVARVCKDGVERAAWGEFMAWPGGVTRGRLLYQQVTQRPSFKMVISCALQREREQRAQEWWFEYVKRREDEDGSFGQSGWEDRKTCEARLMLAQRRRLRMAPHNTRVFSALGILRPPLCRRPGQYQSTYTRRDGCSHRE